MAVRRGTATPSKVYRGTVPVQKIMRGTIEVWSASHYPLNGAWGPVSIGVFQARTVFEHTITESGNFTLTAAGTGGTNMNVAFYRDGNLLPSAGTNPGVATANLVAGDTIRCVALATAAGTYSGTWSIVKN